MDIDGFNASQYARTDQALTRVLRRTHTAAGLPATIRALEQHQREVGFIQFDARAIERWQLIDRADTRRRLAVQYNPQRSARPVASGAHHWRHARCVFCPGDVPASQNYRQFGYELAVDTARAWVAWMNPYPIQPTHFIAAPREHEPQEWILGTVEAAVHRLEGLLDVLLALLERLPGFVGFHNSPGAGATQPHLHLQFFERPGYRFPLEEAAAHTPPAERASGTLVGGHHPVPTMYFQGSRQDVIAAVAAWAHAWLDAQREILPTLAANVIATCEATGGLCNVYIVPRSRLFERVPMLSGRAASLEMLGELVLSSPDERDLLHSGRLTYEKAWSMLAALETPGMPRPQARAAQH